MLVPLASVFVGLMLLLYAALAYTGSSKLRPLPSLLRPKGNKLWATGLVLLALALILGVVGYFDVLASPLLRPLRAGIGAVGLVLLGYQLFKAVFISDRSARLSQAQRYWELLYVLVAQNLSVRYRGSFLGVYWSLLNPLIMTGIYTVIFGAAFAEYYDDSFLNYVLAAFTGLVVTNFYSSSTSQALPSVVGNGGLLNKIRLPVGVFPISSIAANVFQFSVGVLPLLVIVTIITSKNLLNVLALSLPIFSLALVCMGVGFFVSTLYVFFRDLSYFYELVCFVAWIGSPVFYPPEIVPEPVQPFLALNPLATIMESLRQISLSGDLPDLSYIGHSLLSGMILLTVGWLFFRWLRPQFMDLL